LKKYDIIVIPIRKNIKKSNSTKIKKANLDTKLFWLKNPSETFTFEIENPFVLAGLLNNELPVFPICLNLSPIYGNGLYLDKLLPEVDDVDGYPLL
jgi:hypothetical protein